MRQCPSCQKSISFWTFFKPTMFYPKDGRPVVCKYCNQIVSVFWDSALRWVGVFELALVLSFWKLEMPLSTGVPLYILINILLIMPLYLFVPFKNLGSKH